MVILRPVLRSARRAASRPAPGPLIKTSTSRKPLVIALRAVASTAIVAAKGVLLRAPLNPLAPEEPQQSVLPRSSVIVTSVLLNVAVTNTFPFSTRCSVLFAFMVLFRYYLLAASAAFGVSVPVSRLARTSLRIAPTVLLLPRRVRALDLVRCPREGKPRV